MGYYIRLSRIIPDEPPADKAHLRQLVRWLYRTVLHFGMLLVACPDICLDARAAANMRAEFLNKEKHVMIFESYWIKERLGYALDGVVESSDHESSTRHDDMESSEADSDTLDHRAIPDQPIDSAQAINRSQSTSPVVWHYTHGSPIESRRLGTVSA
ncbi:hypothetical protein GGI35DRAFT_430737 [Trichoderma velutinum]